MSLLLLLMLQLMLKLLLLVSWLSYQMLYPPVLHLFALLLPAFMSAAPTLAPVSHFH